MRTVKRIVCLANSRKLSGRCVAGKEFIKGQPAVWIRPVSGRGNEEVSRNERQYRDGSDPRVLDIIEVPLLEARPRGHQQENWLLEPDRYWTKVGRATWSDLQHLVDPAAPLWLNGHSTNHGQNDRVPVVEAGGLRSSLRLIRVNGLNRRALVGQDLDVGGEAPLMARCRRERVCPLPASAAGAVSPVVVKQ